MEFTMLKSGSGDFDSLPVGKHSAVIVGLEPREKSVWENNAKTDRTQPGILWKWQTIEDDKQITRLITASDNERSNLYKFLDGLLGVDFEPEEIFASDTSLTNTLKSLIGQSCTLDVKSKTSGGGTFVAGLYPPKKGTKKPVKKQDSFEEDNIPF